MSSSLFGYTDFQPETRVELAQKIFARMNTVFSNWLAGEYKNPVLKEVLEDDVEVNNLQDLYWCLWCHFNGNCSGLGYYCPDAHDWLAEEMEMTQWPTRVTRVTMPDFQRARTFSMHGPNGEVIHVNTVPKPHSSRALFIDNVEQVSRRSTRAKKQREFYYGF
jgi:hypothetical protein